MAIIERMSAPIGLDDRYAKLIKVHAWFGAATHTLRENGIATYSLNRRQ